MDNDKIVVVTTTKYTEGGESDKLRLSFVCEMLRQAKEMGITMLVLDDSLPDIHQRLMETGVGNVFPSTVRGMGPGRRLIFHHAMEKLFINQGMNDGAIIWTEEKPGIFNHIGTLTEPILCGQYYAVIPSRLPENWSTYPPWQEKSEKEYNSYYAKVTGRTSFDPALGPVIFKASILKKLLFWNPTKYGVSDTYLNHWLPIIMPDYKVVSVPIDIPYPMKQREVEEKNEEAFRAKRQWQKEIYMEGYRILTSWEWSLVM